MAHHENLSDPAGVGDDHALRVTFVFGDFNRQSLQANGRRHFQNLRLASEFLISNSPRKLNVVAQDFVADFQPTDAEGVSDIIQKIHDQILHMGWKRTTDNALKFDVATEGETIWNWIDFWSSAFWAELPEEYVPPPSPDGLA
jgi:hypothetical protein